MTVLVACRRLCLSSLLLLFIGLPVTPNYGIKLAFSVKKKKNRQNGGRLTQTAHVSRPLLLQWGPTFTGRGRVTSVRLASRFGTRFETNTKLLRGVIRPISTPNDYLNTVFDDVVSLCRSCRNNALPRSPREKLRLFAILSLREQKLSLQKRNMLIV